jgi:predicted acetyltransferase
MGGILPHVPRFHDPDTAVMSSFLAAMAEFVAEGASGSQTASWVETWAPGWERRTEFDRFVASLRADALPDTPRPERFVPCTTLWWVDEGEYVGRLAIRHRLNAFLLDEGGHIGYDVRPTRRRAGHATAMLLSSLPVAAGLGIDEALVTCDEDNVASIRVIEACGGVLEDRRGVKRRYWVPTS